MPQREIVVARRERAISPALGGRAVFDNRRPKARQKAAQMSRWDLPGVPEEWAVGRPAV